MHTIIALNDVFSDTDELDIITEVSGCGYSKYIIFGGEKRLRRLFSTRQQDYLRLK